MSSERLLLRKTITDAPFCQGEPEKRSHKKKKVKIVGKKEGKVRLDKQKLSLESLFSSHTSFNVFLSQFSSDFTNEIGILIDEETDNIDDLVSSLTTDVILSDVWSGVRVDLMKNQAAKWLAKARLFRELDSNQKKERKNKKEWEDYLTKESENPDTSEQLSEIPCFANTFTFSPVFGQGSYEQLALDCYAKCLSSVQHLDKYDIDDKVKIGLYEEISGFLFSNLQEELKKENEEEKATNKREEVNMEATEEKEEEPEIEYWEDDEDMDCLFGSLFSEEPASYSYTNSSPKVQEVVPLEKFDDSCYEPTLKIKVTDKILASVLHIAQMLLPLLTLDSSMKVAQKRLLFIVKHFASLKVVPGYFVVEMAKLLSQIPFHSSYSAKIYGVLVKLLKHLETDNTFQGATTKLHIVKWCKDSVNGLRTTAFKMDSSMCFSKSSMKFYKDKGSDTSSFKGDLAAIDKKYMDILIDMQKNDVSSVVKRAAKQALQFVGNFDMEIMPEGDADAEPIKIQVYADKLKEGSDFFRTLLSIDMLEKNENCIRVVTPSPPAFLRVLDFLYGLHIEIESIEEALALMMCGHQYGIEQLTVLCRNYFKSCGFHRHNDTAFLKEVYDVTEAFGETDIRDQVLSNLKISFFDFSQNRSPEQIERTKNLIELFPPLLKNITSNSIIHNFDVAVTGGNYELAEFIIELIEAKKVRVKTLDGSQQNIDKPHLFSNLLKNEWFDLAKRVVHPKLVQPNWEPLHEHLIAHNIDAAREFINLLKSMLGPQEAKSTATEAEDKTQDEKGKEKANDASDTGNKKKHGKRNPNYYKGLNLNANSFSGKNIVMVAIEEGFDAEFVSLLVDTGTEFSAHLALENHSTQGFTALIYAVHSPNFQQRAEVKLEMVSYLLSLGAKVDTQAINAEMPWTPLLFAILHRNVIIVEYLIKMGANVNTICEPKNPPTLDNKEFKPEDAISDIMCFDATPLFVACNDGGLIGCNTQIVQALIDAGADVLRASTATRTTLTMVSAFRGRYDLIHLLISACPEVALNFKNSSGWTVLHFAAYAGQQAVLESLQESGLWDSRAVLKKKDGDTPAETMTAREMSIMKNQPKCTLLLETYFKKKKEMKPAEPSLKENSKNVHSCVVCGNPSQSRCSSCKQVYYCGRKHQLEHWKTHKSVCRKVKKSNNN